MLGASFVLDALSAIHVVQLRRNLNFRGKLAVDGGRAIVKALVGIGCAVGGLGAWSLVLGQIAGCAAAPLIVTRLVAWRPRLRVDAAIARDLLRFGGDVTVADVVTQVVKNLDLLVVGSFWGSIALGNYSLAAKLPELLIFNLLWSTASVLLPTYALVQGQPAILRDAVLSTYRFSSIVCVPLGLGLVLAADPVVRVFLGSRWIEVVPILRVLAISAVVVSVGLPSADLLRATGRTRALPLIAVSKLVALLLTAFAARPLGPVGIALANLAATGTEAALLTARAWGTVPVSAAAFLTAVRPALLSGAALAAAALPVLGATAGWAPWLRLASVAGAGAAAYLATLWTIDRQAFHVALSTLRPARNPVAAGGGS